MFTDNLLKGRNGKDKIGEQEMETQLVKALNLIKYIAVSACIYIYL